MGGMGGCVCVAVSNQHPYRDLLGLLVIVDLVGDRNFLCSILCVRKF